MEKSELQYVKGDQKGIGRASGTAGAGTSGGIDCLRYSLPATARFLYLHCLPADISGLSCPEGEVDNSVFDRYLVRSASRFTSRIAAISSGSGHDPVKA